jgi:hypothetical protein
VVAAVEGSVAVIGNDEAAVRACLDVRRGARPSLASDEGLREMRARVGGEGALAFGYAPRGSVAKAAEVLAPAFVGGISQEPHIQSVLATLLPQLLNQTLGGVGWSAHAAGGNIEDLYFVSLAGGMAERLQGPLAPAEQTALGAAAVLPADTFQVTFYDFRSPEEAFRGTGAALSSQVDVSSATLISLGLKAFLKPYGVENPREFLRACGTQLATARAQYANASRVLNKATVQAPFTGVVAQRQANAGDVVSPGTALFTVVDPASMQLEASVPAEALSQVRVGMPIEFSVNGYPNRTFTGRITRVSPVADPTTRQVKITAAIPNAGNTLVGGLFAEGRVSSEARTAPMVAVAAVDERGLRPTVVRLKNGKIEKIEVGLGIRDAAAETVEITSGLTPGDTVLLGAARGISPGTPVKVSSPTDVKK